MSKVYTGSRRSTQQPRTVPSNTLATAQQKHNGAAPTVTNGAAATRQRKRSRKETATETPTTTEGTEIGGRQKWGRTKTATETPTTTAAEENPENPGNFRPIALTSCTGKVFTTIVKNWWLTYLLQNKYMDTTIQKAFVHGIPGCTEHQLKPATAIQDARTKRRSLTICWLDLANAYGSVHHQLIQFALKHYHTPSKVVRTVANLYTNLSVTITTPAGTQRRSPSRLESTRVTSSPRSSSTQ